MDRRTLRQLINSHLSMADLLKKHMNIIARPGSTLHCPFHTDSRKSAKFYPDNAIYCFTESKMYRPYDLLRSVGVTDDAMKLMVPETSFVSMVRGVYVSDDKVKEIRSNFIKTGQLSETVQAFYLEVKNRNG